jgi:hypothetical protein
VFPQTSDEYDYSGFFKYLKKIRYQGGISVEAKTNAFDAEAPKAIAFLRSAYEAGASRPPPPSNSDYAAPADPAAPAAPEPQAAATVRRVDALWATLAVLSAVGTYVAAQVDFIRRHHPACIRSSTGSPGDHIWCRAGHAAFFVCWRSCFQAPSG